MKKTYWVAIPIIILVITAGVFGTRKRTDMLAVTSQPSPSPTQLQTQTVSLPMIMQPTISPTGQPTQTVPAYIVIGWNNLGMHCYNPDFSNLAILPPYNTLLAQVIKIGDPPQIITSGVTVEYSFPENTYSAGIPGQPDKTNFWDFEQVL